MTATIFSACWPKPQVPPRIKCLNKAPLPLHICASYSHLTRVQYFGTHNNVFSVRIKVSFMTINTELGKNIPVKCRESMFSCPPPKCTMGQHFSQPCPQPGRNVFTLLRTSDVVSKSAAISGWLREKWASPPSLDPILSLPVSPSRTLF